MISGVFPASSGIQWDPYGMNTLAAKHLGAPEPRIWVRRLGSPERTNNPSRRLAVPSSGGFWGGILWKFGDSQVVATQHIFEIFGLPEHWGIHDPI